MVFDTKFGYPSPACLETGPLAISIHKKVYNQASGADLLYYLHPNHDWPTKHHRSSQIKP